VRPLEGRLRARTFFEETFWGEGKLIKGNHRKKNRGEK